MKNGFGLLEVLISAVVLGFLIVGLNKLQMGNREMVLRVRARDVAQIVAQNFIDSLNTLGISIDTVKNKMDEVEIEKKKYTRNYTISADTSLKSVERSDYTQLAGIDTVHIPAKKVDLKVSWIFKNSTQSINLSRIIK